jgi:uncharacterized membrane protein
MQSNSSSPPQHENLWPARTAIVLAAVLYITLPDKLTLGYKWIPVVLELALLVALTAMAPVRHRTEARIQRVASISLIALINLTNISSLVLLIAALLHKGVAFHGAPITGETLLLASVQIWLTNILVFALWYWEIDCGGPVARYRASRREPDFQFPQMLQPAPQVHWRPHFVDYLYVSFTNATAFSPTDTMPLTVTAKLLMMVQALASLITVALVAARAVNILS